MSNSTSTNHRGDVVLVGFHATNENLKVRRPAVIVAVDPIKNEVAILPLNGKDVPEHKGFHVSEESLAGRVAGLKLDTVIDCRFLARIPATLVVKHVGHFDENIMQKLDKLLED